jgi:hypothetical protein
MHFNIAVWRRCCRTLSEIQYWRRGTATWFQQVSCRGDLRNLHKPELFEYCVDRTQAFVYSLRFSLSKVQFWSEYGHYEDQNFRYNIWSFRTHATEENGWGSDILNCIIMESARIPAGFLTLFSPSVQCQNGCPARTLVAIPTGLSVLYSLRYW